MNVAEVASACNVTVPEAESKSEDPLATAHERFVSIFPAVPAVTVYVTLPPSSTDVAEDATVISE